MNNKINYIVIASEFMSNSEIDTIISNFEPLLLKNEIIRTEEDRIEATNTMIYFIASGGVERKTLDLINRRYPIDPTEAVVLVAHPGNNSLPASLELLAYLKQNNREGSIFMLNSGRDQSTINKMLEYINSRKNIKPLAGMKIGLIGKPSDWLIASSPEFEVLKGTWGANIEFITTKTLFEAIEEVDDKDISLGMADFRDNAITIVEPNENDLVNSLKVLAAMKKIIRKNKLDAVSLRCFDLVTELNTTGCFALAKLNDEGICASCEGDLVSLISMLWLKKITGKTTWMANPAEIRVESSEILLAHCTIAFNLVDNYSIRSHFESGLGIGIQGKMPLSPVTMVRIGGRDLDKIWILEGKIDKTLESENLCRTQALISVSDSQKLEELLNDPLGNHITVIPGHYKEILLKDWIGYFGLT
ncbi:hypothetical protein ACFLYK_03135 [Candidatus Cloacimonadota bacterium]